MRESDIARHGIGVEEVIGELMGRVSQEKDEEEEERWEVGQAEYMIE